MATFKRFEELSAWNAATDQAVAVFKLTEAPSFRFKGDLVTQLRRAALSVANNIAEGFERGSTAELISFLYIARGSAGEVRSMLRFALRLGEMPGETAAMEKLVEDCETVSRQIRAWLAALQNSDIEGQRHYVVILREVDLVGIAHHIEHLVGNDLASWVDVGDAFGCHVHLVTAYGACGSDYLAVDVARSHNVIVVEVDCPYPTACEHLNGIAAHAAHAKHRHAALRKLREGIVANEHPGP